MKRRYHRIGFGARRDQAGDTVTVSSNPLKNGHKGGSLLSISVPDGRVLSGGARATNEKTDLGRVER